MRRLLLIAGWAALVALLSSSVLATVGLGFTPEHIPSLAADVARAPALVRGPRPLPGSADSKSCSHCRAAEWYLDHRNHLEGLLCLLRLASSGVSLPDDNAAPGRAAPSSLLYFMAEQSLRVDRDGTGVATHRMATTTQPRRAIERVE